MEQAIEWYSWPLGLAVRETLDGGKTHDLEAVRDVRITRDRHREASSQLMQDTQNSSVRVAMVQMLVEGGKPESNLKRARARIIEAAREGARVAVLPECLDLGWTDTSALELAEGIPGPRSDALAAAARETRMYLAAGLTEKSGDKIYNSAIHLAPDGTLLSVHRKINELDIARGVYSVGDHLAVVGTEFGKVGVNICADNLPESLVLGHSLARMGARLILSPSAWAVDADHDNHTDPYEGFWLQPYRQLATRNRIAVIGVSAVGCMTSGPWSGRKMIGCSLAVGPDGQVLGQAAYGEEAEMNLIVDVPLGPLTSTAATIGR